MGNGHRPYDRRHEKKQRVQSDQDWDDSGFWDFDDHVCGPQCGVFELQPGEAAPAGALQELQSQEELAKTLAFSLRHGCASCGGLVITVFPRCARCGLFVHTALDGCAVVETSIDFEDVYVCLPCWHNEL